MGLLQFVLHLKLALEQLFRVDSKECVFFFKLKYTDAWPHSLLMLRDDVADDAMHTNYRYIV